MQGNIYIYILIMAAVTYAIRVVPLTMIRKHINNRFIRSFLYYVPFVTLAIMTFPAMVEATRQPIAGAIALIVGVLLAWFGASLFKISISCCVVVFIIEMFI